ncbi:MAG: sulfatase, partial [Candidatus Omnitrophica bacterium]|nr:sulfatase [Candidatus Omnitrophota bacterium]
YCQQAICMASRASLLSGYRPDKGKIYNKGPLYECIPDALSLNKHFLANGYETLTMGKIYHHRSDEKFGWSREAYHPEGEWEGRGYLAEDSKEMVREYDRQHPNARRSGLGPAFEGPDVPDDAYIDGKLAQHAIEELNRVKDRPFFMAVGFKKPHLPFNAPKKYWDLYDESAIELADNPFVPKGAPEEALTNWGELRGYIGMPKEGDMPDDLARQLIHGYYACVSYTDAQVGKVLDELGRLGLSDNTIVVLWGDHGWKLGEHSMWCKHTNFELDTHSTLMISAPGMASRGKKTRALTEFVDIYPTLCDLCGLEKPEHLEGTSFAPLLENPDRPWKKAAFSQYPRGDVMGYSMRTDRYRYTEWQKIKSHELVATELYDHQTDPDENVNVAGDPENAELVKSLNGMLREGYEGARP